MSAGLRMCRKITLPPTPEQLWLQGRALWPGTSHCQPASKGAVPMWRGWDWSLFVSYLQGFDVLFLWLPQGMLLASSRFILFFDSELSNGEMVLLPSPFFFFSCSVHTSKTSLWSRSKGRTFLILYLSRAHSRACCIAQIITVQYKAYMENSFCLHLPFPLK